MWPWLVVPRLIILTLLGARGLAAGFAIAAVIITAAIWLRLEPRHLDHYLSRSGGEMKPAGTAGEVLMARCEVCGNEYDKSFEVRAAGTTHIFDSFECAIHKLAPQCAHCGCRVIGHGVEAEGRIFCCANCARQSGVTGTTDRA